MTVGLDDTQIGIKSNTNNKQKNNNTTMATDQEDRRRAGAAAAGDDQIELLIQKLQQAQLDAPEIAAALQNLSPEAAAALGARLNAHTIRQQEAEFERNLDREDSFPRIGPGYSDDISVVSDLTTPTVMTGVEVKEEEHYKDMLSPLQAGVGGGPGAPQNVNFTGMTVGPKRKNLVSQVGAPSARRTLQRGAGGAGGGGAAAQRRRNYQEAMAKLKQDPNGYANIPPGAGGPANSSKKSSSGAAPAQDFAEFYEKDKARKKSKSPSRKKIHKSQAALLSEDDEEDVDDELDDFKEPPPANFSKKSREKSSRSLEAPKKNWGHESASSFPSKKQSETFIDDDGFFLSNDFASSADPFAVPAKKLSKNTAQSPKSKDSLPKKTKKKMSRDDGYYKGSPQDPFAVDDGFGFDGGFDAPKRRTTKSKSPASGTSPRKLAAPGTTGERARRKPNRRASSNM